MTVDMPTNGTGLSWVSNEGRALVTKSVAPSFLFCDFETYLNTNISHRLEKRSIETFVSVNAPLMLLTSLYGWDNARAMMESPTDTVSRERAMAYALGAIDKSAELGASAVIICDDICGIHVPLVDPPFVVEHALPLYDRLAAHAAEVGIAIIFHAEGDIRNYYGSLANSGYWGVHIAHPARNQTREMFNAARAAGLVPLGGIIAHEASRSSAKELAEFACSLAGEGEVLICDDGNAATLDDWRVVIDAMLLVREMMGA